MNNEEKEIIATLNTMTAAQQLQWFRENPDQACHLFWWLLGYSHLSKLNLSLTKAKGA